VFNAFFLKKLQKSSLVKRGPLLVVIIAGSPWGRNIFLRVAMTLSTVVDLKTSNYI